MNQIEVVNLPNTQYPKPSDNWVVDPSSGFLFQPLRDNAIQSFSLEKKKQFVSVYSALFPDVVEACKQIGISSRTFYWHLKFDTKFSEVISDIRDGKMDKLESAMFQVAIQPKPSCFMDRIAMLRAYRPERFTERRINLGAKDLEPEAAHLKQQNLGTIIDAELVGDQEPSLLNPRPVSSNPEPDKKADGSQGS